MGPLTPYSRKQVTCVPVTPLQKPPDILLCPDASLRTGYGVGGRCRVYSPKVRYLSELLPGIGPGPEMGLVLAQGDCHQRVATVIEYWPVREGEGARVTQETLGCMVRAKIL